MLLHTIGRADRPGSTDAFTDKYVFPGGYIPSPSEMLGAIDGLRWYVSGVEVWRLHYANTLRAWYDRTVAARAEIVAPYDERSFRQWSGYEGAYLSFADGPLVDFPVQFCRNRTALPITRD